MLGQALSHRQKLLELDRPDRVDILRELAENYHDLADMLRQVGRPKESADANRRAQEFQKKWEELRKRSDR
jgi:hypothetical protein